MVLSLVPFLKEWEIQIRKFFWIVTSNSNLPVSIDDQASYPSIPNALVNVIRSFRFRVYVDIAIFGTKLMIFFQISAAKKIDEFAKFSRKIDDFSSCYEVWTTLLNVVVSTKAKVYQLKAFLTI